MPEERGLNRPGDATVGAADEGADLSARILDAALQLAEERSWEAIRLHQVAARAGIGLAGIGRHFREKDELIDAWFDRADAALLAMAAEPWMPALPVRERLQRLTMAWLEALAPHRRVTREMILAKLEPGHLHIQFPAVMRISRTVQWLREAALLDDSGLRRALAESVLTAIFLATFVYWLGDDTEDAAQTRHFLDRQLAVAERAARTLPGFARVMGTAHHEAKGAMAQVPLGDA